MTLDGKVVMITGGSGGLGSVHCMSLARAGCKIAVIGYNRINRAKEIAKEIREMGCESLAVWMDVSDEESVGTGVKKIEDELGPIDILVNNSAFGIVRAVTIVKMPKSDWDHDLAVNLTGPFNTIKRCLPGMLERGWGRIINISSITGTMGGAGQCSYAATKAGLIGLTKTVALEGARKGVTCNALVLGIFDAGAWHEVAPEFQERIVKSMPMRRPGTPQELSNLVVFIASEESSYITGEAIEISGGAGLFTF